jgi:hypothetical protein
MDAHRIAELEQELARAEAELHEHRAGMPAHTVRPAQLQALEDAEERVENLRAQLRAAKGGD